MQSTFQKGRENRLYLIILSTVSLLFVVFFTSKLWLYDDSAVMQTPLKKEITGLDQTTLVINKWEYNPDKEIMEVAFETIHNGDDFIRPTFTFMAREKDQKDEYPVKVVYKDKDNMVVQIANVPNKYRVVGLFVYEHRDKKILETEVKESMAMDNSYSDSDDTEITLPKPAETILIADYRKVKVNKELVTKNAIEYQKENITLEIDSLENEVKLILEEKIPLKENLISSLEQEIESLKSDLEYQVDEEQEETFNKISSNEDKIKDAKEEQKELLERVDKLNEKKEKLLEKLEFVISGNEENSKENVEKETTETEKN